MRSISAPNEDPKEVYELCVNSIADNSLRCRLNAVSDVVAAAAYQYWNIGIENKLRPKNRIISSLGYFR